MDNEQQPATKADVQAVAQNVEALGGRVDALSGGVDALRGRVDALGGRVDALGGRVDALSTQVEDLKTELRTTRDNLIEAMHDTETRLLKAFYGFAETNDIRHRDAQASDANLRDRLTVLERRVFEVEKRLNMPPRQ